MNFESFIDVSTLSEAELKTLSKHGDVVERVWAAWTHGLRLGADFAKDALARLDTESHPGIRRHLIVMLAGFLGELRAQHQADQVTINTLQSIIEAMARFDPDERVRATAWQNLISVENRGVGDIIQGLEDPSPLVRLYILNCYENRWPTNQLERLQKLFGDEDVRLRTAAVARWIECQLPENWFSRPLINLLSQESNRSLRRRLHVLCRIAHRDDLISQDQDIPIARFARSSFLPMLRPDRDSH